MAPQRTIGSRRQVWNGTAIKTSGGLTKAHLKKNKRGRIVSIRKSNMAKKKYKSSGFSKYKKTAAQMRELRKKRKK